MCRGTPVYINQLMEVKMPVHTLKISDQAWRSIRAIAYRREMPMKTVLDKIMTGEIKPLGEE